MESNAPTLFFLNNIFLGIESLNSRRDKLRFIDKAKPGFSYSEQEKPGIKSKFGNEWSNGTFGLLFQHFVFFGCFQP